MTQPADARRLPLGGRLVLDRALAAARQPHRLVFGRAVERRIEAASKAIARAVERGDWVYGVTTGFGSNATDRIDARDAQRLQENLLVSHALGDGRPLEDETVRLALLLRVHALARGCSGIRLGTLRALAALYERDILPVVPSRGSVGASGDLAPLAFLALPLIGHGRVRHRGRVVRAATALAREGLEPVALSYKEGLALVNGMQISLAIALRALEAAETTLLTADVAAALTLEALAGRGAAFDARIHEARGHPGQIRSAARIRAIVRGSRLVDAPVDAIPGKRVAPQDAYGIRCAPQVHGAAADGVAHVREVLGREVDAVTDNPLVFGDDVLSGGNFHGEPIALAADHLRLCVHELGSIAERRLATLVDPALNEGLPAYLAPRHGLHSGYMIPQYVAAALVSEAKGLCFPASADSIPTGANIEDHVSMAPIAARRAAEVVHLVQGVLALELMAAAQAIELRELAPARRSRQVVERLRTAIPFRDADAPWDDALEDVRGLVASGQIVEAAGLAGRRRETSP